MLALSAAMAAGAEELMAPEDHLKRGALRKRFVESDVSGSKAPPELRRQVADELFDLEMTARPTCEPELSSVKVVDEAGLGRWSERWFVRACFERIPYRVSFERSKDPDKRGQLDFKVTPDMGRYGYPVN
jgi:hypothetical protein